MENKLKKLIKQATAPIRHTITRLITPTVWKNSMYLSVLPRPATHYVKGLTNGKPLNCVEIGVHLGANAESILKTLNVNRLYLIDPYEPFPTNDPSDTMQTYRKTMLKRMSKYNGNTIFIEKRSDDALDDLPDCLDYVYVDGDHEYHQVLRDLENYSKKLKHGGVLAGHDFIGDFPGVVKAALEFSELHGWRLSTERADYWMIKP